MTFYDILQDNTANERKALLSTPLIEAALSGSITAEQYLGFLGQAYHHVKHTVPLLMALGSRLGAQHAWLQPAIVEYIEEEAGHEQWILNDIKAAGGDSGAARQAPALLETEAMVAYAYYQIDRVNPLGFLGMVHVLEGTSVSVATDAARHIKQALGLPDTAFSYLTSHGSLDLEHVQHFALLLEDVTDPTDRQGIIGCAKSFYILYERIFRRVFDMSEAAHVVA